MTVGERIRKRREELGMSQTDLALKMGYSGKSSVCRAETYGDNITTNKIEKFAKALDVSSAYLLGWEDSSPSARNINAEVALDDIKLITDFGKLTDNERKIVRDLMDTFLSKH